MRKILKIIMKRLPSFYINVPALRPGTIGAYAFAFVCVAVATALRLAVDPYVVGAQFVTFFPAVVITTLISGFGAGFFCAVLSTAAADFIVLSPRWSFSVEDPANVADLLLFGPLAFYCVILIGRMRMAIEHDQAERALRVSKDRLQLALDAALLGWWQYEPRHGLVSGDRRFREIFDVAKDQMKIEEIEKLVYPDDAEMFSADSTASLDPANPQRSPREYRVQRRDGEVRWVEVRRLACFEGAEGERRCASLVGTVEEITERKKRQERDHLLMREINHRAKNMLSVVDAIAHLHRPTGGHNFMKNWGSTS